MLGYVRRQWPRHRWAVEGVQGVGRPLAQRLLADGETVVDVPAKLSARVRVFDTGKRPQDRPGRRARGRDGRTAHPEAEGAGKGSVGGTIASTGSMQLSSHPASKVSPRRTQPALRREDRLLAG